MAYSKFTTFTRAGILAAVAFTAAAGIQTVTPAFALSSSGFGSQTVNEQVRLYSSASAAETAVFNLINQYRAEHGLAAVSLNEDLTAGARDWAQHLTDTGAPVGHPADANFYENVAYSLSPENAVELWKNSPAHNANLLESKISNGGVGVVARPDGTFAVVFRAL